MMNTKNFFLGIVLSCAAPLLLAKTFSVKIEGVTASVLENVQNTLTIFSMQQKTIDENQLDHEAQKGVKEIQIALQPFGYYTPTIQYKITHHKKTSTVLYKISPGPIVRVSQVDLQLIGPGAKDVQLKTLFNHFPLAPGSKLEHLSYESGKQVALATVINQGYLKATYKTHTIQIDEKKQSAKIQLILETGPLYTVKSITFSKNPLSDRFLERYADFHVGSPLQGQQLIAFQSRLMSSQYFKSVQVDYPQEGDHRQLPVNIQLKPNLPNQYQVGAGYGTDTDIRGKISYKRRYLNKSGHQAGASIAYSGLRNRYEAFYTIPGKHPATDNYQSQVSKTREQFDNKTSNYVEWNVGENKALGDWTRTAQVQYYQEEFSLYKGAPLEQNHFILPAMTWTKLIADNALNPSHGYKLAFSVKGAINTLFSDASFIQGYTQLKRVLTLPSKQKIILRGEFGATYPNNIDQLPLGLRYFTGGDFTVRGYAYKSLGPTKYDLNNQKVVVGGRYLTVGSFEIQQPIWKKFSVATFFDSGNAMNHFSDGLYNSVGIGFRWASPIGPVRLDIAKPLRTEDTIRLHMNIGSDL